MKTQNQELARLLSELEESAIRVAEEVRELCSYLYELRGEDSFRHEYTEEVVLKLLNKVFNRLPLFPVFRPLSYGTTKNNLDQFDWFNDQLGRHKLGFQLANISIPPWSDLSFRIEQNDELKKDLSLVIMSCVEKVGKGTYLADFTVKYALNFIKYFLAFSRLGRNKCPLVCVSNDHTPYAIAFSNAAKSNGIFRVYLQHAFVTELFPPLDFDLSILFNSISLDVYSLNSKPKGECLIIPRYPVQGIEVGNLIYKKELALNRKFVVIYLGGSNSKNELFKAIKKLKNNPVVGRVAVKLHPSPRNHELKSDLIEYWGGEILVENDVLQPHVAICGNSSVVLKLLSFGVRCFHLFSLDARKKDYYGFVAGGGALELNLSDLDGDFLCKWSESWYLKSREKYIVNPDSNLYLESVVKFDVILRKIFRSCSPEFSGLIPTLKEPLNHDLSLDFNLSINPDELRYLNLLALCSLLQSEVALPNKQILCISPRERHELLSRFYRYRHPDAIKLMLAACKYDPSWEIRLFYKYHTEKIVALNSRLPWKEDIKTLFNSDFSLGRREIILNEILIYVAAQDAASVSEALEYVEKLGGSFDRLSVKCKLKLIDVLDKYESAAFKEVLLSSIEHGVTICYSLAAKGLGNHIKNESSSNGLVSHKVIVDEYLALLPEQMRIEIGEIFSDIERIIHAKSILDLRMLRLLACEREKFWGIVSTALFEKRPLAMIRLSDGEGYIFSGNLFKQLDCSNRERHWWGIELHDRLRGEIQESLQSAVRSADIIGIPSVFRFLRDFPATKKGSSNLKDSVQMRGLLQIIDEFRSGRLSPDTVVEERANDFLFENLYERLQQVLPSTTKVILISSLSDMDINTITNRIKNLISIKVPTRSRTFNNKLRNCPDEEILPFVYKEIAELVSNNAGPGVLVLCAAGVLGKLFIGVAKSCGAVALDIGEVAENLVRLN